MAFGNNIFVGVDYSAAGQVLDDLLEAGSQRLAGVAATPRGVAHLDDLARHHEEEDVLNPRAVCPRQVVLVLTYSPRCMVEWRRS